MFPELGIAVSVVGSVTQSSALLALVAEPVWFCLKAQPKREHLAATALRRWSYPAIDGRLSRRRRKRLRSTACCRCSTTEL